MDVSTFAHFRTSSHAIPPAHPSHLSSPPLPFQLTPLRLKHLGLVKNGMVACCSSGSDEFGSVNGSSLTPNKLFVQEAIGAEYGEGFETFRADGPSRVDVDYLNDKMQDGFLQRMYARKPEEAYGLIFSWDNVVADTRALKSKAWEQLASEEGKDIPEDGDMQRLMLNAGVDHMLHKHFLCDKTENELDRLKSRFCQLYYDNLMRLERPREGLEDWLEAVYKACIPCAVVSSLDRRNMVEVLERMGLNKYFQAIVTQENGMESIAHRFLSAAVKLKDIMRAMIIELFNANKDEKKYHVFQRRGMITALVLKLDRKPSKCIVFEDDPRGVIAAHNCTMMVIALMGAHPKYDLEQADIVVASFSELSVINLRRIFADNTFMDLQEQIIGNAPLKRKLTVDTIF